MAPSSDILYVWSETASNGTTPATDSYPQYVGYLCALVAVLLYGSNFVPVKKYYTGDGMFFQFILCNGIFLVGFVVQLIRNSDFYPIVMLGGAIWATGNLCVVPIIKTIGMGLGLSLWGCVALLAGWASGKFGWFDTNKDDIKHPDMNYASVAMAVFSIVLYVFVKDEVSSAKPKDAEIDVKPDGRNSPLPEVNYGSINRSQTNSAASTAQLGDSQEVLVFKPSAESPAKAEEPHSALHDDRIFIEDFPPKTKKLTGVILCVFSGLCYGLNFEPSIYVQDNWKKSKGASQNGLDYVFAQYCGIYLASSIYFYIYCALKKNKPKVYPKVILPGIISGILWAIATTCWFVANKVLSPAVSFPIITTCPTGIASLFWGVCIFHEVRGLRNILVLVAGFLVMVGGAVLSGLSKQ